MEDETKLQIVASATFAPSSHNSQPWKFRITEKGIDIFADLSRALKYGDPTRRLLYLSLGAALKNMVLAAEEYDYSLKYAYGDDLVGGRYRRVVSTTLIKGKARVPLNKKLFEAITTRVTYRGRYLPKKIPDHVISTLTNDNEPNEIKTFVATEAERKEKLAQLTSDATYRKMSDSDFRAELAKWLRPNYSKSHDGMHGFTHEMNMPISIIAPIILKNINVALKEKHKARKNVRAFPAVAVLTTGDDSRHSWIKCGEIFQKHLLFLASCGLLASIKAAPIEDGEARRRLFEVFRFPEQAKPQIVFGFGYPMREPRHSARRTVDEVLL